MITRVRAYTARPGRLLVTGPAWTPQWRPPAVPCRAGTVDPSYRAEVQLAYTAYRCRLPGIVDDYRVQAQLDQYRPGTITQVACTCRLDQPCHGDVIVEWLTARNQIRRPLMLVTCWRCAGQTWVNDEFDDIDVDEPMDEWRWTTIPLGTPALVDVHPGDVGAECAACATRPAPIVDPHQPALFNEIALAGGAA